MRPRFLMVMAALIAATALATWRGPRTPVGLGSVRQLWSDALRDADQPALRLTRLSVAEETRLGDSLIVGTALAGGPCRRRECCRRGTGDAAARAPARHRVPVPRGAVSDDRMRSRSPAAT